MPFIQRFMFAAVALAVAVGSVADSAQAAPVTFEFAGTVTQVNAPPGLPGGDPAFGTPFSGSYTFDSASVDAMAAVTAGSYTSPGIAPFEFVVNIEGFFLDVDNVLNVGVVNGASSDFYSVFGCVDTACSSLVLELLFQDLDATVFGSDALPLDAPPLAAFELAGFTARGLFSGEDFEILGHVTSLTCVEGCVVTEPTPDPALVPEPSTVVLCTTGLIATVMRRRRSSSLSVL